MRSVLAICFVALFGVLTACEGHTPGQTTASEVVEFFATEAAPPRHVGPEKASAIAQWLNDQWALQQALIYVGNIEKTEREWARSSTDCYAAADRHWPASSLGWVKKIIKRESGGSSTAKNPSSSASGCLQLLKMHDWRFAHVGCSPSQKFEADCGILAGLHLYKGAGTSPWAATNY